MSSSKRNEELQRLASSFMYPTYVDGIHIGDSGLTKSFLAEERAHEAAFNRDLFDIENEFSPDRWRNAKGTFYHIKKEEQVWDEEKEDYVIKETRERKTRFHRNTVAGKLFLARMRTHLLRYSDEAYGRTSQRMGDDNAILAGVTSNFKELEISKDKMGNTDMTVYGRDMVEVGLMYKNPFQYAWLQYEKLLQNEDHRIRFDGDVQPDRVVESIIRKYILAIHHALNSYFVFRIHRMFNEAYDMGIKDAQKLNEQFTQYLNKASIAKEVWEGEFRGTISDANNEVKVLGDRTTNLLKNFEVIIEMIITEDGAISSWAKTLEQILAFADHADNRIDEVIDKLDMVRKKGVGATNNINKRNKEVIDGQERIGVKNFQNLIKKIGTKEFFVLDQEQLRTENDILGMPQQVENEVENIPDNSYLGMLIVKVKSWLK